MCKDGGSHDVTITYQSPIKDGYPELFSLSLFPHLSHVAHFLLLVFLQSTCCFCLCACECFLSPLSSAMSGGAMGTMQHCKGGPSLSCCGSLCSAAQYCIVSHSTTVWVLKSGIADAQVPLSLSPWGPRTEIWQCWPRAH